MKNRVEPEIKALLSNAHTMPFEIEFELNTPLSLLNINMYTGRNVETNRRAKNLIVFVKYNAVCSLILGIKFLA